MMSSKPVSDVRRAVLVLLSEGPMSGTQLCRELQARTGEACPVNADQVYAALRQLEQDGLVESNDVDQPVDREQVSGAAGRPPWTWRSLDLPA